MQWPNRKTYQLMWPLKKANISALAIYRSTTSEKVNVVLWRSHRTLQAGGTRRRFRLTTGLQMLTWRIVGRMRSAFQKQALIVRSWYKNRAVTWTINTNLVLEETFFVSVFLVFMSAWWNNKNQSAVRRGLSRAEGSAATFALLQFCLEPLVLLQQVFDSLRVCNAHFLSLMVGQQSLLMLPQVEQSVTEAIMTLQDRRKPSEKLWMMAELRPFMSESLTRFPADR